jgi:signal transduction histidine kinase
MAGDLAEDRPVVLSMLPATPGQRRIAAAVALLSACVFLAAAPFAKTPLPRIPGFVLCYETALILSDLITAALLFGQFAIARARGLLVLAGGYLFTASMVSVHLLSFPGAFAPAGLLSAGPQSTSWLYMFWHGGFSCAVIAYAALGRSRIGRSGMATPTAIAVTAVCVLALVTTLTVLATAGWDLLPVIMRGDGYTSRMIFVVGVVWALTLTAILTLWRRRPHSVLDLWLMVVLCAWLCDVALGAMLNAHRFDLGFYAGRAYGLAAASFVLIVLLFETIALYARLAQSLSAERRERELRISEMRSELIHVSRLSELGQMVSALAHEVNQPIAAIGNYIGAGRRLVQQGDLDKAQVALARATDAATRAGRIIQRLRDFVRKGEVERQVESLSIVIEEAVALAVMAAERKGAQVDLQVHPQAAQAWIDKIQIQQVLLNLIRNAIEAMGDIPQVRLVVATAPSERDDVEVSVTDFGPGLPAQVRERLFQPFVTTKSGGMGVGLSICRSIIEAHGGRLWAEDNPGGGTVFRFTVPNASAASQHIAAA